MSHSVERVFSQTAATYDTDRAKLIPGYVDFYATALGLIPRDAGRILDLGAGTGLFSALVRERFPNAHLHLIDNSPEMLVRAEARMTGDRRYASQLGDYTTCEWAEEYDCIVSALSIHHLEDGAKQTLFKRVRKHLKPGGVFVNADQILQPTPALEAAAKQAWLDDVRALGATEPQVEASCFRQTEDRCATTSDQLAWLREAGYRNVRCAFTQGRFAVYAGTRPAA